MFVVECVQKYADSIVLIQVLPFGEMRANGAGRVFAFEHDIKILLVVREMRRRLLARCIAVTGNILAKVCDGKLGFTGAAGQKVVESRSPRDTRYFRKWNRLNRCRRFSAPLRKRHHRACANPKNPKTGTSKEGPHGIRTV